MLRFLLKKTLFTTLNSRMYEVKYIAFVAATVSIAESLIQTNSFKILGFFDYLKKKYTNNHAITEMTLKFCTSLD